MIINYDKFKDYIFSDFMEGDSSSAAVSNSSAINQNIL